MTPARQIFVVPPLDGTPTGGTVFNRSLLDALNTLGSDVRRCSIDEVLGTAKPLAASCYWLDTLYLRHAYALRSTSGENRQLGLLVHYLPSLITNGDNVSSDQLTAQERFALETFDAFLVTSRFMCEVLLKLNVPRQRILVVEPGRITVRRRVARRLRAGRLRAVMVAHLLPNKGVLPFVQQLSSQLRPEDRFDFHVVGHGTLDVEYALDCTRWIDQHEVLRQHVHWHHELGPDEVVEQMNDCNLLVSASVTESYGIAIAEARTLGLPVLARAGGNVAFLVDPQAGGELVDSVEQLAGVFLELCRNPAELLARNSAALEMALPPRSWLAAARDFTAWVYDQKNERANEIETSKTPTAARSTPG